MKTSVRGVCVGLALALAVSLMSVTDAEASVIDRVLGRQLSQADKDERVLALVHGTDARAAIAAVRAKRLLPLETWERVGIVVAMGTPAQIRSLDGLAGVTRLEGDKPIRFSTNTSHIATRGREAIAGFTATDGSDQVNVPRLDGRGVSIAVIDSGVDGTHPMFQRDGRSNVIRNMKLACSEPLITLAFLEGLPALPPSSCPEDYDAAANPWLDLTAINDTDTISAGGHGTHVAATAAGVPVKTSDGRKLYGAAPGAEIISLSVGTSIAVYGGASAMNWVLENHRKPCGDGVPKSVCPPIKVVNNSWGGEGGDFDKDAAVAKISTALLADGVTIVWSAGNDGGDGSVNLVNREAQHPRPGLISVANYDDAGRGDRNHQLNEGSSRGERGRPATYPDVSAPGTDITAACRPYLTICSTGFETTDPNYNTISGTSMAAPHVAGIVAQMLQANPRLSPASIEHILENTAHRFTAGGPYEPDPRNPSSPTSFDKGHGLVDVVDAVSAALGYDAPSVRDLCPPDGAVVVDAEGDATQAGLADLSTAGGSSESTLDITRVKPSWSPSADVLKVFLRVADLTETNPSPWPGISFDIDFVHEEETHSLVASRDDAGTSFTLDGVDISGRFDADDDVVSFTITRADIKEARIRSFGSGDRLSDFSAFSRYSSGAGLAPVADDATGRCVFKLGTGTLDYPAPGSIPPALDGAISLSDRRHTWTGGPVTNVHSEPGSGTELFGCAGITGDACHDQHLRITVPDGGAVLDVQITADVPLNDFDLYVLNAKGDEIASSVNPGTLNPEAGTLEESVLVRIKKSGVYTIRVVAFATVESTYEGVARLSP